MSYAGGFGPHRSHRAVPSRDYICLCPRPSHVAQPHGLGDPRSVQNDNLAPARIHVLVFDAPQCPRANARTHDNGVDRRCRGRPAREEIDTTLDDLADVLDVSTDDGPTIRQETRKEVADVERWFDAVRGV